jgi:chemosensory pili system protein ChpA (sensor histidine kinase/response regulator)
MADNHNYAALEWVIGEIDETLKLAQQALEAYVENPEDTTRIRFCLTHIHQVHGSLQMVEFLGAALLAEEMEGLAQALMNRKVADETEALELMMQAILQLPLYISQVKSSRKDDPATLLPLLNDLRAARGSNLLSQTRYFDPDISASHQTHGSKNPALKNPTQLQAVLQKLRKMYQYSAAGYIRGIKEQENLDYLGKVFDRLIQLTRGTKRQPLWEIAQVIVESLEAGDLEVSAAIKALLRQLDKEIKVLVDHGVKAFDAHTDDGLIKNLLYYVARSSATSLSVQNIKNKYGLQESVSNSELGASGQGMLDSDTMRSVVASLQDELETIKHALDVGISGRDSSSVSEALPVMQRVADTLTVLGFTDMRAQVLEQISILTQADSGAEVDNDTLMHVASELIAMEQRLTTVSTATTRPNMGAQAEFGRRVEINQAQESVLRESRNGLEKAKESIVEYIASQWDVKQLSKVPALLAEIRGGLSIIPLSRPAVILQSCSQYIERELIEKAIKPDWNNLDTLADAISSVEYYIETLTNGSDDNEDALLTIAEESVASLGYAVAGNRAVARNNERPDADASTVLKKIASVETVEIDSLPESRDDQEGDTIELLETAEDTLEGLQNDHTEEGQEEDVATTETLDDDEDEIDEEILEIFVEEANEVLEAINEFFPKWSEDFDDRDSLTEFRRAFHTLKGSGRMVKANDIGELAWSVENMLNRIMDNSIEPHVIQVDFIGRVRELFPEMIAAFEAKQETPHKELIVQYMAWGQAISNGEFPSELQAENLSDEKLEPQIEIESSAEIDSEQDTNELDGEDEQAVLWGIFVAEALTHLEVVEEFIASMEEAAPLYTTPTEQTQRALHTLKGSAHMADLGEIAQLVTPLESFAKEMRTYMQHIDDDILQLLKDGTEYVHQALDKIRAGEDVIIPKLDQYKARVAELRDLSVGPLIRQEEKSDGKKQIDPELLSIFMSQEMDILLDTDEFLTDLSLDSFDVTTINPVVDELDTLAKGADHAGLPAMNSLSCQLAAVYREMTAGYLPLSENDFDVLNKVHEELLDMVDAVAAGQNPKEINPESTEILDELKNRFTVINNQADEIMPEIDVVLSEEASEAIDNTGYELHSDTVEVIEPSASEMPEPENTETENATIEEAVTSDSEYVGLPEDMDLDILEIFLEEADELMEEVEKFVHDWEEDWSLDEPATELKRVLHTLKGGARLSGMMGVGDVAHDFETYLINLASSNDLNKGFFSNLHNYQDALLRRVEKIRAIMTGEYVNLAGVVDSSSMSEELEGNSTNQDSTVEIGNNQESQLPVFTDSTADSKDDSGTTNVVAFQPKDNVPVVTSGASVPTGSDFKMPAPAQGSAATHTGGRGASALATKRSAPQEVIKVSAELIEELVNLAGETSISRGRTEEQLSEMGFTLEEMDSTINRLQEQLRRLDIETEAQVLFRQEQMEETDDFDPLEMDRYSHLQQLSRSLIESASDLLDLKSTLSDKTRDTETLLLQQSRINTELQEGLMRSRMVQFSRLVPRLRRIIRQVANELGKNVNFELANVEGEMDRTVLERMVAPLEHMLRNSVDHGIESPEERLAAGKPETGRVLLTLGREGGDVLLRLTDDGRGINLRRVREKAIERGLMADDAQLSDRDIMQFILHAGFSTAEAVTQISGRGVGMDVVTSEIKQLGGSISIDSKEGEGTEFTVRLPFTVSVNRALMIRLGDDRYAVPLNTIEGIVRVSPFELEHYYQNEEARFEYAGEQYQVRYLGSLLHTDPNPKLEGQAMPLPVILVRTSTNSVAIQVDMLMGSREIVVKSLGSQFGLVQGVSGATVMGDGSVVVIVDPHALIRKEVALESLPKNLIDFPEREVENAKVVMVVDDSVTVRKVTSRFLERQGFEVLTANDGADAMLLLQDHVPDVMLLDIEMPRMDGFEVAKNIRSSSRLKDLPIIMITSRTGDKHRDRALSLGVNKYMGKPYQEEALLENILSLVGSPAQQY